MLAASAKLVAVVAVPAFPVKLPTKPPEDVVIPVALIFLTFVISSKSVSIFPTANLVPADIDVVPTPNA